MIRLSLSYIYNLANQLEPVRRIQAGGKASDAWFDLVVAFGAIDTLINNSVFASSLKSVRQPAANIMEALKEQYENGDKERVFSHGDIGKVLYYFDQFRTVLLAEMETLNSTFITQKRGYDTAALMYSAEVIFPPDLVNRVPESVFDIREAGKCIAVSLPTAAGYHLHRANEAILHRYYDAVTGGKPRPNSRNIGDYLAKLREYNAGDARVLAALKDLKDLHRNPLVHPEQTLETVDEAIALLNSIQSVAVHMLKEIPVKKVDDALIGALAALTRE